VAGSLDDLVVSSIDSDVVDVAGAGTIEDKITGLTLRKRILGSFTILILCTVRKGLSCALVDSINGKTAAVKTNNVTVITIRLGRLLCSLGCSVDVASIPGVRILSDHTCSSLDDLVTLSRSGRGRLGSNTADIIARARAYSSLGSSLGARRLGHASSLVVVAGDVSAASESVGSRASTRVSCAGTFRRTHAEAGRLAGDVHTALDIRARAMTRVGLSALLRAGGGGDADTTANTRDCTDICGQRKGNSGKEESKITH